MVSNGTRAKIAGVMASVAIGAIPSVAFSHEGTESGLSARADNVVVAQAQQQAKGCAAPASHVVDVIKPTHQILPEADVDFADGTLARAMKRSCRNFVVLVSNKSVQENEKLLNTLKVVAENAYNAHGIRIHHILQVHARTKNPEILKELAASGQSLEGAIMIYARDYRVSRGFKKEGLIRGAGDFANILNHPDLRKDFEEIERRVMPTAADTGKSGDASGKSSGVEPPTVGFS